MSDKNVELKYPLSEDEKQLFRDRLEEVLARKDGNQVIILWDKDRLTDYYQNICGEHLLEKVEESAREYSEQTQGQLIHFNHLIRK